MMGSHERMLEQLNRFADDHPDFTVSPEQARTAGCCESGITLILRRFPGQAEIKLAEMRPWFRHRDMCRDLSRVCGLPEEVDPLPPASSRYSPPTLSTPTIHKRRTTPPSKAPSLEDLPCTYRGEATGNLTLCGTCPGNRTSLKVFRCALHQRCVVGRSADPTVKDCTHCRQRDSYKGAEVVSRIKWAYAVTTVPERRGSLLPRTLRSLAEGGFPHPHLYVDGDDDASSWRREFNLEVTCRSPRIRLVANWLLGLYELYIRHHQVDMYAMFQDDVVVCRNVLGYLSRCKLPPSGYLNLYSFPVNEELAPTGQAKGWYKAKHHSGKGGQALVFTKEQVRKLLTHRYTVDKHQDEQRGWRSMDGMVVEAMMDLGYTEYCHSPGLVQHTGHTSTFNKHANSQGIDDGKPKYVWSDDLQSNTFPGEDYDAMDLLEGKRIPLPT